MVITFLLLQNKRLYTYSDILELLESNKLFYSQVRSPPIILQINEANERWISCFVGSLTGAIGTMSWQIYVDTVWHF